MIYCLDVLYRDDSAQVACIGFKTWTDEEPSYQKLVHVPGPLEPYVPGQFYKRELPCLLLGLEGLIDIDTAIVDSHVWLGLDQPGLDYKLHESLSVPVVGIAKTKYLDSPCSEVFRGQATKPLYVDSVNVVDAPELVRQMWGPYRIPYLIKLADSLSRTV